MNSQLMSACVAAGQTRLEQEMNNRRKMEGARLIAAAFSVEDERAVQPMQGIDTMEAQTMFVSHYAVELYRQIAGVMQARGMSMID